MPTTAPRDRGEFEIALICALPLEASCVQKVFDKFWEDENKDFGKSLGDTNAYTTGTIGDHNVVLAYLPNMGTNSAAALAGSLRVSFPGIKLALVVGICGGVPYGAHQEEILLGDIIVSQTVIQYDFGRQYPAGFQRKSGVEDTLGRSSPEIRALQAKLETIRYQQRIQNKIAEVLRDIQETLPATRYPGRESDHLYSSSYVHQHHSPTTCDGCDNDGQMCEIAIRSDCQELGCDPTMRVKRQRLVGEANAVVEPMVHLGIMGSGNSVFKSGQHRDQIAKTDKIIAFEMEGAGVWECFPTIVIKGVCDYADSHKRKEWQYYAAATAAAYTKAVLAEWCGTDARPSLERRVQEQTLSFVVKPPAPVWHIPFDHIPGFVGREQNLRTLKEKILDTANGRIISVLGLGGVGKSRLALELAYQVKSEKQQYSIFWIQAADRLTFDKDVLEVGKKLRIPGIDDNNADATGLVKQRLSDGSSDSWLLILDNADDEELWGPKSNRQGQNSTIVDWLPRTTHGSILITTRSRRVASFLAAKEVIELHAMSLGEARQMFTNALEDPKLATDSDATSALLERLTFLPLAIIQAASYLNMTQTTIKTYISLMDEPEEEVINLLSEDFYDRSRYSTAPNPVAVVWFISFEQINSLHSVAAKFLGFMACLHEKSIPLSLLPRFGSKNEAVKAFATLRGYSFISKQTGDFGDDSEEELYDVHRLVYLAARSWLKSCGQLADLTRDCIKRVSDVFPPPDHGHRSTWTRFLPHAKRLCEDPTTEGCPERYQLLWKIGKCFIEDGRYTDAINALTQVVKWREQEVGGSVEERLLAYDALGQALCLQGVWSEAIRYLREAVDGQVLRVGEADPDTLTSKDHLASTYWNQGRFKEAEELHGQVAEARAKVLGPEHPSTLTSMGNLASTYWSQKRWNDAEQKHKQVIEVRKRVLGSRDPDTLSSMANLASTYSSQGRWKEAEEIELQVLEARKAVLRSDHPDTLTSMANLASTLCSLGRYKEAEELEIQVIEARRKVIGSEHPNTLNSMSNLAHTLKRQGRNVEAIALMTECVRLRSRILGKDHIKTTESSATLAKWKSKGSGSLPSAAIC